MMTVLLCHERRGPTIEVRCRQFEATSSEQTRLYCKYGSGWEWVQSTPFALAKHEIEGLDDYISRYTKFCLTKLVNEGSLLSQIFAEAERNIEVNTASDEFNIKLRFLISGSLNVAYAETVGCKSYVDEGLGNCRT